MQPGTLIRSDVTAFTSYIKLAGIVRPALSWSIDRSIESDLPSAVAGGTGVSQATGSIEWAGADVSSGATNPWNASTGWIPKIGDTVEIWAGDDNTSWKQFVGVIDSSAGQIGGGLSSKIIDRIDALSTLADLPSLVDVMPPVTVSADWRRFRLTPRWAVAYLLRRANFFVTPKKEVFTSVDVPAFGGMWPFLGGLLRCQRASNAAESPIFPGGGFVADVNSAYTPRIERQGNQPVQLTMNIDSDHNGVASLETVFGSASVVLRATPTEVLFSSAGSVVCRVPRSGSVTAQALFKNGLVTLRTSAGSQATGSIAWSAVGNLTEVLIAADANSKVNGFIVSHPETADQEFINLDWTPTANIVSGAMHGVLAGIHASRGRSARDVLDEISGALLWPQWIDENGIMQVIGSDILRTRPSVLTLTTADDIRELSWQSDLLGMRDQVQTSFERLTVNRRTDYSLPVWSPSESVVLRSGEEHVSVIDPGSDEWLMVDTELKTMEQADLINKGVGTWVGGVYADGAGEEWTNFPGTGQQLEIYMRAINDGTWKIFHQAKTLASGKQVELRSKRGEAIGTTVLWPYWWDKNLPIVRAKGSFSTNTVERPAVTAAGKGPTLSHSCGPWATGSPDLIETVVVDNVTSFLVSQTTDPHPTIPNMRVGFDPRIQLGDVITVSSVDFMGVTLKCLVIGKSTTAGSGGIDLSLDVRVIDMTQTFTSWEEWSTAWGATANYVALEYAWGATATYDDFNSDSKKGTQNNA